METSYLKTLELDKIIARASEGCVCKEAREQLLALEPQCDPDEGSAEGERRSSRLMRAQLLISMPAGQGIQ